MGSQEQRTADHSMPYTAAVALMFGTVESRHFDDQYLENPDLLELVSKVKVSVSEEANSRAPEAMLGSASRTRSYFVSSTCSNRRATIAGSLCLEDSHH